MERIAVTCRLPANDVAFLDSLATSMERDRTYLLKQAVEDYIASHRWQLEEIDKSIAEADSGVFASDAEVKAAFDALRG